ncbi:hypothetical protein [Flavobacterium sp.]|uniref:hypothetical protein n=1 Tax=Flavobacterium sp. TaxID=239 RepID=UPI00374DCDD6
MITDNYKNYDLHESNFTEESRIEEQQSQYESFGDENQQENQYLNPNEDSDSDSNQNQNQNQNSETERNNQSSQTETPEEKFDEDYSESENFAVD